MAVSRYYQPVQQQYVSQFIPEDMRLYKQLLDQKQGQYDQTALQMQAYEDELLKETALPEYDTEQLKAIRKEYEDFSTSMAGKDLADPNNYREVASFIRKYKNDERLGKIRQGVASKAAYDKLVAEYKKDPAGLKYAIENDPFARAYRDYLRQEGDNKKFGIDFIGGKETFQAGVNIDASMEEMFDNMSDIGKETIASISGNDITRYYKEGFTGKTPKHIQQIANTQFRRFKQLPAYDQLVRRYAMNYPSATREQIDNEIKKDLLTVGMERVGVKTTTTKAGAMNSILKAGEEKADKERKAQLSMGNTSVAAMGNTTELKSEGVMSQPLKVLSGGLNFAKKFGLEILKGMDGESSFEGGFSNWVKNTHTQSMTEAGVGVPTEEQTKRTLTAGYNFINSMSDQQRKNFKKAEGKEQDEMFQTWLKGMAATSIEEFGEIPLDSQTKGELNDLVKFNANSNVPVVIKEISDQSGYDDDLKMSGISDQPTMQELTSNGFKVKQSFIYTSGAAHPGQRLGIIMEDDNGNRVTVATKGSLMLGDGVNKFIPSEATSYVSDYLTQAKYNYENNVYKIPLHPNAYHQMVDKTGINNMESTMNSPYIEATVHSEDPLGNGGYEISIKDSKGNKVYSMNFGKGKEGYDSYKEALTDLSKKVFDNTNLNTAQKIEAASVYLSAGNPLK